MEKKKWNRYFYWYREYTRRQTNSMDFDGSSELLPSRKWIVCIDEPDEFMDLMKQYD